MTQTSGGSATSRGFSYAPGLDGVRALAVAAVVTYHLGTTGDGAHPLPGGFLGVDVFFVLSGYLITSLLLVEVSRHGRISIKQFYLRRARRLLPALYALLLAVGMVAAFWLPQQAVRVRGDLIAAVSYVTNWWLIAQGSSYFGGGGDRPAMLTHLWSLAIEEQFYVIWPLVLIAFARFRAQRSTMLFVLATAITASTVAASMLYEPWGDPSRVYYGTDTRALAPLMGAAVAIAIRPWLRKAPRRSTRTLFDLAGLLGLVGLVAITVVVHDTDPALYLGGFLVIAALAGALVAAAGHPGTLTGRMLGIPLLRWLGDRSYAVYLWHWPVCALTRPGLDVPLTGWAVSALRIVLTVALAELSYWLIERPIRRDGFLGGRAAAQAGPHRHARRMPAVRAALLSIVLLAGASVVATQLWRADAPPAAAAPVDAGPDLNLGPLEEATLTAGPTLEAAPTRSPRHLPKVVFFGDSQGMSLLVNKPADLSRHLTAVDATIEACGMLPGRVTSRSGERHDLVGACPNWRSKWADDARRLRPQIAVVMVGAWDVFDLTTSEGKFIFGTPAWDALYINALNQGIAALRDSGAQVALSLLPCYHPIRASAGYWPERGDNVRTRHVNDLLRAAAGADPDHVFTIEPPVEFCTDPKISADRSYRWDGVHYYKRGAALYFKKVVPQLLILP